MKPRTRTRAIQSALGALACVALLGVLPGKPPAPPVRQHQLGQALASASSSKLQRLYDQWVTRHELRGGDRNVVLALGTGRGLTAPGATGRGTARLDLVEGTVEVSVTDLGASAAARWDVWLVDNRAAQGASVLPDATDELLRAGELTTEAGRGSLRVELGPETFTRFEVDVVLVAPAGQAPTETGALYGMPKSFQRLYSRSRRGELAAYEPSEVDHRSVAARMLAFTEVNEARAAGIVVDPDVVLDALVAQGADLFINETFAGNGRTCATCHPPQNNFTIDPEFIARLPANDPLFVAEFVPALAELEVPALMRSHGLILENVDGLDRPGVMRSVNHTLAMSQSLTPPICVDPDGCQLGTPFGVVPYAFGQQANIIDASTSDASGFAPLVAGATPLHETSYPLERTGWGGDGAPGGGTLREFAIGAITQHFPRRLDRVAGVDFRLPTDEELDALELFQLSLGRDTDVNLRALRFRDPVVERGREIFTTSDSQGGTVQAGRCEICHFNAGANATPEVFGAIIARFGLPAEFFGNQIFPTAVNDLTAADGNTLPPGVLPRDGGFGVKSLAPGDCVSGHFDFSLGFPQFVPHPPGGETGGWGSIGPPPFVPTGICTEAFNTPPLVEAADTPPFFHDHSIATIEDAVRSYSSAAFNNQPLNQLFISFSDSGGIGIQLTEASSVAVARFLRVLNALENLRQSDELARAALGAGSRNVRDQLLARAAQELDDAREVLEDVGLHPVAAGLIEISIVLVKVSAALPHQAQGWHGVVQGALAPMGTARDLMVVVVP